MTFPHLNSRAQKLADELDLPASTAEWLALCALHSGCFLRSQLQFYGSYSEVNRMYSLRIINRLKEKKLIKQTPVDSLGLLTRVTNKITYRLLGIDNVRHRRLASWPMMFRRLLALDYVLEHPELPWLPTENEKVACFDHLAIDRADLPSKTWNNTTGRTVRLFANKHPIAVDTRNKLAHFIYTDSNETTTDGLRSWRVEHSRLWTSLARIGLELRIVHASFNTRLKDSVSRVFSSWSNESRPIVSIDQVSTQLKLVRDAIRSNDESKLAAYGGFNGALQASASLHKRLQTLNATGSYSASYSTWLSDRLRQAVNNPNPSGSHSQLS